jgi:hypothetical protein
MGQAMRRACEVCWGAAADLASEYIDSAVMTHRVRQAGYASARIEGRYGVYRTRARLSGSLRGDWSCPSLPM